MRRRREELSKLFKGSMRTTLGRMTDEQHRMPSNNVEQKGTDPRKSERLAGKLKAARHFQREHAC